MIMPPTAKIWTLVPTLTSNMEFDTAGDPSDAPYQDDNVPVDFRDAQTDAPPPKRGSGRRRKVKANVDSLTAAVPADRNV